MEERRAKERDCSSILGLRNRKKVRKTAKKPKENKKNAKKAGSRGLFGKPKIKKTAFLQRK